MAENLGDAVLRLTVDDGGLKRGIKNAESSTKRVAGKLAKLGGIASGLFAGFSAIEVVREMDAIQKANQQTTAALQRVGAGAKVSISGVQALAGELQQLSGIDDQVIQTGQNMILTMGAIDVKTRQGAKTFANASKAMVNFAEATGTSANAAGKQFAKSIAAASQGVLLLPRGLKLSADEQGRLKKAFEKGSTAASRQAALVEVLGKKFAGSAKLTNVERWAVLKDRLLGVGAAIGEQLMPYVTKLADFVGKVVTKLEGMNGTTKKVIAVVIGLGVVLVPIGVIVGTLVVAFGALGTAIGAVSAPILAVIAGVTAIGSAFVGLVARSATFRSGVLKSFQQIKAGVMKVVSELRKTLAVWGSWARSFWRAHGAQIMAIIRPVFSWIKTFIGNSLKMVQQIVIAVLRLMRGDWKGAWHAMVAAMRAAFANIKAIAKTLPSLLLGMLNKVIPAIAGFSEKLGKAIVEGIIRGIKWGASKIINAVTDLGDKALQALKKKLHIASPSRVMRDQVGIPIAEGIASGVRRGSRSAMQSISDLGLAMSDVHVTRNVMVSGNERTPMPRLAAQRTNQTPMVQKSQNVVMNFRGDPDPWSASRQAAFALRSAGLVSM